MTLSAGARDIAAWPRRRFGITLAVTIVFTVVAAGVSGLPPFGAAPGTGWRYPLLVLLAAAIGLYGAAAVHPPVGAEMTLCDLRWPVLAAAGTVYAGQGAEPSLGLVALLGIAALTLMVWALVQRLDQERAALQDGTGEVCVTCRPLFASTARRDATGKASAVGAEASPGRSVAESAPGCCAAGGHPEPELMSEEEAH